MSLAVPFALTLASLALPIILFYILKVRLRRIPVSTNLFWKQIYDEKPPRSIWQHFRHLMSLLAQLMLLALIVFALTDPRFSWQALQSRRMVAVIDNSASMQATDISPTRFDASIVAAIKQVDGMRFGDKMAIVLAGERPEVILGMSDHIPTLKRALRQIKVSDNPTKLESAIELGKRLIGEHANGNVVVFTDGCATSLEKDDWTGAGGANSDIAIPDRNGDADKGADEIEGQEESKMAKVDFRIFGGPASNVGITQFQVRRSLVDMLGYEVLVSVKNGSLQPVQCRLEIELAGAVVDVLPLTLEPDELWTRSLEKTSLAGGELVARIVKIEPGESEADDQEKPEASPSEATDLDRLNSLTTDDVAWAILPAQKVQNVLLITKGNLFLRMVFAANPLVNVTIASEFPEQWPADTLIVLHRMVPEKLPPGNVFVVDPDSGCDAWEMGEDLENPIVTRLDTQSALMTHVRLDNVLMPEARKLVFKSPPHVLAESLSADPIYAELKRESGKTLVLSVNLDRSDLAFRTAFPIMVTNALNWFAGASGNLRESASTGEIVSYEMDAALAKSLADDRRLVLVSPAGLESPVAVAVQARGGTGEPAAGNADDQFSSHSISIGPLNESGIWTLQTILTNSPEAGKADPVDVASFAVNVSNQRETDLTPPTAMLDRPSEDASWGGWLTKPFWYYLTGLACVLFVTEWFLYQRRFIS